MTRISVLVGHGESSTGSYDPGATSRGYEEFKISKEICKYAVARLKETECECELVNYDGELSLQERINKYRNSTEDLIIEVHLNAAGGSGAECYYQDNDEVGKKIAGQLSKNIALKFNIKDRGAKAGKQFGIIRETNPRALLLECCFIDSADLFLVDTTAEQKQMGETIADTLISYYRLESKGTTNTNTSGKIYTVQVGAFADRKNAENMVEKLKQAGFSAFIK